MSRDGKADPSGLHPALALNPEAGAHPVCEDPQELAAALRAGERTWSRFPYYEARYGERGRAFTRSDSAWIVTLARSPQEVVDEQVLWLGRVLASRGMPRWLLQVHLEHLAHELSEVRPKHRERSYAPLERAAELLERRRRAQLPDASWNALDREFERAADPAWRARLPHTGLLIGAAVADERDGLTRAVSSLEEWLADATRFPPSWIEAVRAAIAEARQSS